MALSRDSDSAKLYTACRDLQDSVFEFIRGNITLDELRLRASKYVVVPVCAPWGTESHI